MSLGRSLGRHPDLNVTPLIDVLLVLLIIFMVITPSLSTGMQALVPQPPDQEKPAPRDDIVITVLRDRTVRVNQEPVALADLDEKLRVLFKNATNHVIFVRGQKDLDFRQVVEVIDIAKGAGLDRVALMTQ